MIKFKSRVVVSFRTSKLPTYYHSVRDDEKVQIKTPCSAMVDVLELSITFKNYTKQFVCHCASLSFSHLKRPKSQNFDAGLTVLKIEVKSRKLKYKSAADEFGISF